jgi:hypothetical protein
MTRLAIDLVHVNEDETALEARFAARVIKTVR